MHDYVTLISEIILERDSRSLVKLIKLVMPEKIPNDDKIEPLLKLFDVLLVLIMGEKNDLQGNMIGFLKATFPFES